MTTAAAVAIIAARIEKTSQICDSAEYTLIYDKQVRSTYLIAVSYQDLMLARPSRQCRCPVSFTTRAPWRLFSTVALFVLLNLLAIEIEHEEAKRR